MAEEQNKSENSINETDDSTIPPQDAKKNEASENELKKYQTERDEYLSGWQRARADFENYKKDEAKRRLEIIKFFNEELIMDLLEVLDSFNLAKIVAPVSETETQIKKGVMLIEMQFKDILKKYGLGEIKTDGAKFDPNYHEAIEEVESDPAAEQARYGASKESGVIVETISKGYFLNGKVIRAAKVKVAK